MVWDEFFGSIWVRQDFGVKIWFGWDEVFGPIWLRQVFFLNNLVWPG